jgi:hypothetical protein
VGINAAPELHVCPACGSDLVQPVSFEPREPDSWYVEVVCPSCWRSRRSMHDRAAVERFDAELARGDIALLTEFAELSRSNMEEEVERFARALAADAILPMDF